jgi:hypothetical protein
LTSSNNRRSVSGFAELGGMPGSMKGLDRTSRSYKTEALKLNFRSSALKVTMLRKNNALRTKSTTFACAYLICKPA